MLVGLTFSVDRFTVRPTQNIHLASIGKILQGSIHRGEPNRSAFVAQHRVHLLCALKVVNLAQGRYDGRTLAG